MTARESAVEYPRELIAYERTRARWRKEDIGKIVLIRGEEVVGVFGHLTEACAEAQRFGQDRVLLRQIGAPEDYMYLDSAVAAGTALEKNGLLRSCGSQPNGGFTREWAAYERHRGEL